MKIPIKMLTALIICVCGFLTIATARDYEAEKIITKSFRASRGHTLSIENKYGNVNIQTWNKNEVNFEIKITTSARKQNDADDRLKSIDVEFSQSDKTISAKTVFDSKYRGCNNCSMDINYQVMVPQGLNYRLDNKYGNINIPDVEGNTDITVKYGNLITGNFSGSRNNIDVKYGDFRSGNYSGDNNTIDVKYGNVKMAKLAGKRNNITTSYGGKVSVNETNKLSINIKYSNLNIGTAETLDVESGYTNTSIDKVLKLSVLSKYENYDIGEVDEVDGTFSYTNLDIAKLGKKLKIDEIKYGIVDISNVNPDFDAINIDARHTNVKIKFDPGASYNVDAYTRHASIKTPAGNVSRNEPDRYSERVQGTIGSSSLPKANVKITNDYGNIDLR
ncbi:MAG: hypothetical protein LBL90_02995 [Prevotellaceae bacterium]|jgi:hypothetical protein|nr:hypothetical protein [Prevotellaceae bacterium]